MVLCPLSRKVRMGLAEKKLPADLYEERSWRPSERLAHLSPSGSLPVLCDRGHTLVKVYPIVEYLEEEYPEVSLMGRDVGVRAEVRRLMDWFDGKFDQEVTQNFVYEKVFKRSLGLGGPDSQLLKEGRTRIHDHLAYIGWLFEQRNWLAGPSFSWADISAAAHLSCIDYLGDIPWDKHSAAKDWYMRVKSRPTFRPFLMESFVGIPPAAHYRVLDF